MANREQPYDPYIPAGGAPHGGNTAQDGGNQRTAALQAVCDILPSTLFPMAHKRSAQLSHRPGASLTTMGGSAELAQLPPRAHPQATKFPNPQHSTHTHPTLCKPQNTNIPPPPPPPTHKKLTILSLANRRHRRHNAPEHHPRPRARRERRPPRRQDPGPQRLRRQLPPRRQPRAQADVLEEHEDARVAHHWGHCADSADCYSE